MGFSERNGKIWRGNHKDCEAEHSGNHTLLQLPPFGSQASRVHNSLLVLRSTSSSIHQTFWIIYTLHNPWFCTGIILPVPQHRFSNCSQTPSSGTNTIIEIVRVIRTMERSIEVYTSFCVRDPILGGKNETGAQKLD